MVDLDEVCDLTELTKAFCAHCRGDGDVPLAELVIVCRFTAQYDGRCCNCDGPYLAGERIGRTEDGGYACGGCCDQLAGL
jgi:hypothetical protein